MLVSHIDCVQHRWRAANHQRVALVEPDAERMHQAELNDVTSQVRSVSQKGGATCVGERNFASSLAEVVREAMNEHSHRTLGICTMSLPHEARTTIR